MLQLFFFLFTSLATRQPETICTSSCHRYVCKCNFTWNLNNTKTIPNFITKPTKRRSVNGHVSFLIFSRRRTKKNLSVCNIFNTHIVCGCFCVCGIYTIYTHCMKELWVSARRFVIWNALVKKRCKYYAMYIVP